MLRIKVKHLQIKREHLRLALYQFTCRWLHGWQLTRQVLVNKDWIRVCSVIFLHTLRTVAQMNFAAVFVEALIPRRILPLGSWQISLFYWTASVCPQVRYLSPPHTTC